MDWARRSAEREVDGRVSIESAVRNQVDSAIMKREP